MPSVQLAVQPTALAAVGRAAHNTARIGRVAAVLLVKVHADACSPWPFTPPFAGWPWMLKPCRLQFVWWP